MAMASNGLHFQRLLETCWALFRLVYGLVGLEACGLADVCRHNDISGSDLDQAAAKQKRYLSQELSFSSHFVMHLQAEYGIWSRSGDFKATTTLALAPPCSPMLVLCDSPTSLGQTYVKSFKVPSIRVPEPERRPCSFVFRALREGIRWMTGLSRALFQRR
ncbi:hypothetical protein V8F06_003832 [Rhypophila decipiens]